MFAARIILEIESEDLIPKKLIDNLSKELIVLKSHQKGNSYINDVGKARYKTGAVYLIHPKHYWIDDEDLIEYENIIVSFLKNNISKIRMYKDSKVTVNYELYDYGDLSGYSLFDKSNLKIIAECGAAVEMSIFKLPDEIEDDISSNLDLS